MQHLGSGNQTFKAHNGQRQLLDLHYSCSDQLFTVTRLNRLVECCWRENILTTDGERPGEHGGESTINPNYNATLGLGMEPKSQQ